MEQVADVEIPLEEASATIFRHVQLLISQSASTGKSERFKRIWEPTYTYVHFALFFLLFHLFFFTFYIQWLWRPINLLFTLFHGNSTNRTINLLISDNNLTVSNPCHK